MVLPIVQRELRVAARRKGTHWARFLAAAWAMVIVLFLLLGDLFARRPQEAGHILFCILSGTALTFCILAGMFLSAGSLCTEKRDGTLGLLFLTDLKGWDIVLGKLTASSLVATYALLAAIPMLGLPLLMGGVTLGEFGRMVLVLLATLLFSLSLGMLTSAICWETRTAMFVTLGVQIALTGGLFLVMWVVWEITRTRVIEIMLPSPLMAFTTALDARYASRVGASHFWISIGLIVGMAVAALAGASWLSPRVAGDEPVRRRRRQGEARRADSESLTRSPFAWLAGRDRFPGWPTRLSLGLLFVVWGGFLGTLLTRGGRQPAIVIMTLFMAYGLHVLVKVLMAVQATRQLSEDRRLGALELILVTPLSPESIVGGLRKVFHRQFFWMQFVLQGVNLALLLFLVVMRPFPMPGDVLFVFCLFLVGGVVLLPTDAQALSWVGVWAALQSKRPSRAVFKTIARVLAPPWICAFLFVLSISGSGLSEEGAIVCAFLWIVLGICTGVVASGRPRWELQNHFRALVAGEEIPTAADRVVVGRSS